MSHIEPEPLSTLTPSLFIEPLGSALRFLRGRRKLKQFQLAEKARMTKAMLSSYETGKALPSLLSLSSILLALGADFRELQEALDVVSPIPLRPVNDQQANYQEETGSPLVAVLQRLETELRRVADSAELLTESGLRTKRRRRDASEQSQDGKPQ